MLLLIAAAAALEAVAPVAPERQARATVRIERAAVLRFDEIEQEEPERLRTTELRESDGSRAARLVEFE
jgi:hypothetical protein